MMLEIGNKTTRCEKRFILGSFTEAQLLAITPEDGELAWCVDAGDFAGLNLGFSGSWVNVNPDGGGDD
jgi:hypothetical protein